MIFNFYYSLLGLLFWVTYQSAFLLTYNYQLMFSNLTDLFSRVIITDFFWNSYYYLWTVFWYIPTLVCFFVFVLLLFTQSLTPKTYLSVMAVVFIFLYELFDYWHLNTYPYTINMNPVNFNLLLTNSINKYHPLMFYYAFIAVFVVSVSTFTVNYRSLLRFVSTWTMWYINSLVLLRLCVITFTLFLGSWWALQEGSWGGWWNWDPSEFFGFFIMVFWFINLHTKYSHGNGRITNRSLLFVKFIPLVYVFIQLNFSLVSHNFGIKFEDIANTTQIFFIVWVLLVVCIIRSVRAIITESSVSLTILRYTYVSQSAVFIFFFISLLLLFSCAFFWSFYPLIDDFISKITGLYVAEFSITFSLLVITTLVWLLSMVWSPNIYLFIIVIGFSEPSLYLLTIFLYARSRWSVALQAHVLFILFIYASILGYRASELFMLVGHASVRCDISGGLFKYWSDVYSLSLDSLYVLMQTTSSDSVLINSWSLFGQGTSYDVNKFSLPLLTGLWYQNLVTGSFMTEFIITVIDYTLGPLWNIVTVLSVCLISLINRPMLIIF